MAHLARAITSDTTPIDLNGVVTVGSYPAEAVLGSELVLVTGGSGTSSLSVHRGARGTTAASHAAGTTFSVLDPTSAGGGDVSILGPFTVNFDDTNIGTGIHVVGPLDEGLLVLNAWFFPSTEWTHSGGAPATSSFYISVHVGANDLNVASYDNVQTGIASTEADPAGIGTIYKLVALTGVGSTLGFEAYPGAGSLTAGVADVYLLVTPAS